MVKQSNLPVRVAWGSAA